MSSLVLFIIASTTRPRHLEGRRQIGDGHFAGEGGKGGVEASAVAYFGYPDVALPWNRGLPS